MPAKTGSRNGLSYGWALGENNWNTGMDGNLTFIDRFGVHLSFKSFLNTPPGSPAAGDCHVIDTGPTGAWVGKAGQVAVYDDGAWRYGVPRTGWRAYCEADERLYVYDGGWAPTASEWSASTVSQAEAEAGTATTRRAWTAQRVRQAIAAWWLSASSAFGRTLANVADAAAGRTALGLGTAATANVTTNDLDTTANRVLRVGNFGIGGGNAGGIVLGDIDNPVLLRTGIYPVRVLDNSGTFPPLAAGGTLTVLAYRTGSPNDYLSQLFTLNTDSANPFKLYQRHYSPITSSWTPWQAVHFHGDPLDQTPIGQTTPDAGAFTTLTTTGNVGVGLIPTARNNTSLQTVNGIGFPATQVASSDPNTLDDYEEGTFTPVARGQSSAGTGTYTFQLGKYTKIGRVVLFQIYVAWTAHTGTGNMLITGLPFITSSDFSLHSYLTVVPSDLNYSGDIAASTLPGGGSDTIQILSFSSNSSITQVGMDAAAGLRISGHYFV